MVCSSQRSDSVATETSAQFSTREKRQDKTKANMPINKYLYCFLEESHIMILPDVFK